MLYDLLANTITNAVGKCKRTYTQGIDSDCPGLKVITVARNQC